MNLNDKNRDKLNAFIDKIRADIYPEPDSDLHINITYAMFEEFMKDFNLPKGSKILDIGCGQGVALSFFKTSELDATGITLDPTDLAVCHKRGFNAVLMDQSFLDFDDASFDAVWCRHVLEHSIFPYFTLSEIYRVLKSPGYLYIETPAPATTSKHEFNKNHYSVFEKNMLISLITRTGFEIVDAMDIDFETPLGKDKYYSFFIRKL